MRVWISPSHGFGTFRNEGTSCRSPNFQKFSSNVYTLDGVIRSVAHGHNNNLGYTDIFGKSNFQALDIYISIGWPRVTIVVKDI